MEQGRTNNISERLQGPSRAMFTPHSALIKLCYLGLLCNEKTGSEMSDDHLRAQSSKVVVEPGIA